LLTSIGHIPVKVWS